MAPSTEDDEAALSGTLTADHRWGALHMLGKGAVADGGAAEGCACLHCCLALSAVCLASKDAVVHSR